MESALHSSRSWTYILPSLPTSTPTAPHIHARVSAALLTRDLGDRRASGVIRAVRGIASLAVSLSYLPG